MVLLHAHDKVEDGDEGTDGVGISSQHDVAESNVIVGGDMASSDTGERGLGTRLTQHRFVVEMMYLLVEFDVVEHLQCEGEVTEEDMDSEQTDDAEVTQHAVQWTLAVFTGDFTV